MHDIPPNQTPETLSPRVSHTPIETNCNRESAAKVQNPIAATCLKTKTPVEGACGKIGPRPLRRHKIESQEAEEGAKSTSSRTDAWKESGRLAPVRPIAVTVKQAANLLGTNEKQIRRAIYAREIPAARLGKSYSIAVADLIKWFDRKKSFI